MSVEPLFVVVFSEFSEKLKHNFNYELRMTNDELAPEPPKGDKPQKRLLFVLTGTNDK